MFIIDDYEYDRYKEEDINNDGIITRREFGDYWLKSIISEK